MPEGPVIHVTVVFSPAPRQAIERCIVLPVGATVRQAVLASGLPEACAGMDLQQAEVGVWTRKAAWEQPLRDGDRVEIYRPLRVDPKVARRERFRKQGTRAAGLFAGRRKGGKAGY